MFFDFGIALDGAASRRDLTAPFEEVEIAAYVALAATVLPAVCDWFRHDAPLFEVDTERAQCAFYAGQFFFMKFYQRRFDLAECRTDV